MKDYLKKIWLNVNETGIKDEIQLWLIRHLRYIRGTVHRFSDVQDLLSQQLSYFFSVQLAVYTYNTIDETTISKVYVTILFVIKKRFKSIHLQRFLTNFLKLILILKILQNIEGTSKNRK